MKTKILIASFVWVWAWGINLTTHAAEKPNIIYILADDLGYGDLGCYGQQKLKTPNIYRLAEEGMLWTNHYSGNTVCSPSRAVLMTGIHPGKAHCRGNSGGGNENDLALDPDMITLPRLFKNAGYATGAFGKWGLGYTNEAGPQNPLTHGFDHFTGWVNQWSAHTYYPSTLVRDGNEIPLKDGTFVHDLIMQDAFDFIERNARAKKPFFCYIPTAVPHAAMHAPKDLHEKWRKVFPQFDDVIGSYSAGKTENCPDVINPVAGYAAMMENLDNQVGTLLAQLDQLGIAETTIVIFTSDNGPHGEGGHKPGFWNSNGALRGGKRDLYEGGIRVPFLVRWPGTIAAGVRSDHLSAFWDVLPTMAQLIGQPRPPQTDGISLVPTLTNEGEQQEHEFIYHEFYQSGNWVSRSIRVGDWKVVQLKSKKQWQPLQLFNLKNDPGEIKNLAKTKPDLAEQLTQVMERTHTPYRN